MRRDNAPRNVNPFIGCLHRRPRLIHRAVTSLLALSFLLAGCGKQNERRSAAPVSVAESAVEVRASDDGIVIRTPSAEFTLSRTGALCGVLIKDGTKLTLDDKSCEVGQTVSISKTSYSALALDTAKAEVREASGKLGSLGKQINVAGKISGTDLDETLTLEVYDAFPNLALLSARLRNAGSNGVSLDSVTVQHHRFTADDNPANPNHTLWTFQGSSLKWGKDEIFAMPAKFSQENPFGAPVAVKDDLGHVGGGIPVVAFWSNRVGEAIGHVETLPLALSIPVQTASDGRVEASVSIPAQTLLNPGEVYSTPRTFLAVYAGDFYEPLHLWSDAIEKEGLSRPANNDENYAVSWCGWGYEFAVTPKQMLDTIPKLKELGIHWATLDDGWFNNYGDWQPRQPSFAGNAIEDMVKKFHEQGIKVQLWWLPLGVEDGHYGYGGRRFVVSEVAKDHPDWLILDESGKPARMARNLAALCPALTEVRTYYKQLTERFIRDWDFDGHKLDNIYSTPLCYNPSHHHKSPYDSVNAMGEVYKTIFEATRALKPGSVTQSCPCGTPPSLAWLPFMDQAVTADPVGAVQVRRRIKMYKALLGPDSAVYGDHVELSAMTRVGKEWSEHGDDFASTIGTGGVVGTKFVWPDPGPKFKAVNLTSAKEEHWKKWIGLYNQNMLSKGEFKDLYVTGYDTPEGYAIAKGGKMYFAFFAPSAAGWKGEVELRGLKPGKYRVRDYAEDKDLGSVEAGANGVALLPTEFKDHLLLEVGP